MPRIRVAGAVRSAPIGTHYVKVASAPWVGFMAACEAMGFAALCHCGFVCAASVRSGNVLQRRSAGGHKKRGRAATPQCRLAALALCVGKPGPCFVALALPGFVVVLMLLFYR